MVQGNQAFPRVSYRSFDCVVCFILCFMDSLDSNLDPQDYALPVVDDLPAGYTPRYFREVEFMCANPPCSMKQMDEQLLQMLDDAREIAGIPFHVNSAFRSKAHELTRGRQGNSSHTKGVAIDISCIDSNRRSIMLNAFVRAGFRRIGIYKRFIHVDCDRDKPDAIWIEGDFTSKKNGEA